MQHAFTVRSRETRAKLAGNLNRFIRWKTSDPAQQGSQIFAIYIFHG
jgi:hypothetical protein